MHKINKLTIQNFKFFYEKYDIDFNCKHQLIYGENGSGKSSMFWALFTFFQSTIKDTPQQVQKYFRDYSIDQESLKNRYATNDAESLIEIEFKDDNESILSHKISHRTVNTQGDNFMKELVFSSDFIDYKTIINFYNFTNKDNLDIFPYMERNLFAFINLRTGILNTDGDFVDSNLKTYWEYIKKGIHFKKMSDPIYNSFQSILKSFNNELKNYLSDIESLINKYLTEKFKHHFEIYFVYSDATFNDFNEHNKGRNKKIIVPKILLKVKLLDENIPEENRTIDRADTFLNEAKLTSIALAMRFAILDEKYIPEFPKVLILDDLLLSLDMGNRETVLNIILDTYTKNYQIIFLTHDRLFYDLTMKQIEGKLGNNQKDWEFKEMYAVKDRTGKPIPTILSYKDNLTKALYYFTNPRNLDYGACGNYQRTVLEEILKTFIPKEHLVNSNGTTLEDKQKTLGTLIETAERYFKKISFDTTNLVKLSTYSQRFLNPSSHHSPYTNFFKNELNDVFRIIDELKSYKNEIIIDHREIISFTIYGDSDNKIRFTAKCSNDIRLYKQGKESFYLPEIKYSFEMHTFQKNNDVAQPYNRDKDNDLTIEELYDNVLNAARKNYPEMNLQKSANDIFDIICNEQGESLNEIKIY